LVTSRQKPGVSPGPVTVHPEEKGVDASELRASFLIRHAEAAKPWIEAYHESHEGELVCPIRQSELLATITSLEEKGVDTAEVKAAILDRDPESVKIWLEAYYETHPDEIPVHYEGWPDRAESLS
jgi:hypothetical protein